MLAVVLTTVFSFGVSSCGDDDPEPYMKVGKTSLSFGQQGGDEKVTITTNVKWTVLTDKDWLIVDKESGEKDAVFTVSAKANETYEEREGKITIMPVADLDPCIIKITQSGKDKPILTVSGLDAPFEKSDNSKQYAQELTITCNTDWEISGKPDWLSISHLTGTGNMSISVWPNSVNDGAERKATIIIKTNSLEVSKDIIQKGMNKNVFARPKDILTLTTSTVWGYEFGSELHHVFFSVMHEYEANNKTDADLIKYFNDFGSDDERLDKDGWVRRTPDQFQNIGGFFSWTGLQSNTCYYVVSVSYDKNNVVGEIHRQKVNTKKNDVFNSPYIGNDYVDASYEQDQNSQQVYYRIEVKKDPQNSAYADKFYTWAIASTEFFETLSDEIVTDAIRAYYIWREIKKNPAPHDTYVLGTDRSIIRERLEGPVTEANFTLPANYTNDKYLQIITWCTLSSGDFSGEINWCYFLLKDESSAPKRLVSKRQANQKQPQIVQFNPNKPAKGYKILK